MDSYNYSTYYKGTPKKLSECEYIYLFSSIDPVFSGLPLDLEHLDDIKKAVLENLDKTRKNNKKVDNVYYIDREPEDTRLFEFDMILYCTEELEMVAENPIVGFTRFSSQQRTYSSSGIPFDELRISITFTGSEYEFVPEIILKNTLKTTQSEQPIDGPEDYNYPIINRDGKDPFKGIPGPEEGYLKFTGKVSDFSGDSDVGILTESTLIYHSQDSIPGAGSFFINSGLTLDLEIFSMVKVGIYNGDVVCLRVSLGTGEYSISSLTKINKFRQPYVYITGYLNLTALVGYDFVAYNGSTMLYRNQASGDYLVYHLVEGKYSIYPKSMQDRPGVKHVVLDQWDINGGFRYLEEGDIYKEVYRTCFTPGDFILSDNKYKKKDDPIFSTNLYLYKKKIGSWWVFTNGDNFYYLSPTGLVRSTEEIDPINDKLLVRRWMDTDGRLKFSFIGVEFGSYCIYGPEFGVHVRDVILNDDADFTIDATTPFEKLTAGEKCFLDGLRRKPRRLPTCLPILESSNPMFLLGMFFYIDQGCIYCY